MKNFGDLKDAVGQLVQRADDANYLDKIGVWLQLSHKLLAEIYDYWTELQAVHNFNSAIGTEAYSMPADFDKPMRVYDLTNKKKLTPITEEVYSDSNISNIAAKTTGTPDEYRIYGVVSRLKQMKLGLIPNAIISYRVLYKQIPTEMDEDTDYPFIDADRYLVFDAYGYALKQDKEDTKANFAWQKASEALTALLNNQMSNLGVDYQQKIVSSFAQSHRS